MYSTLVRGIEALEILAKAGEPLGLAEIARRLKTSKSGTHGLLAALVRCGYANRGAGGIYSIGLKAWEIGRLVPTDRLVQVAAPGALAAAARADVDAVLTGEVAADEATLLRLVAATVQGERQPVANAGGFVDFQLSRGLLGVST